MGERLAGGASPCRALGQCDRLLRAWLKLAMDIFSNSDALIGAALEADSRFIDSLCDPGYPATLLDRAGKLRVSPKVGNSEAIPSLRGFFHEHVRRGSSAKTMSAQLRTRLGIAPGLALLIAVAGMHRVRSAINRHRQTSIGATEYRWCSICAHHMERDGATFIWDDPPEGGYPGEDGLCKLLGRGDPAGPRRSGRSDPPRRRPAISCHPRVGCEKATRRWPKTSKMLGCSHLALTKLLHWFDGGESENKFRILYFTG